MTFSSYCRICAMPLSHLCLVRNNQFDGACRIYRGNQSDENGIEPSIPFGPAHSWLRKVVALPKKDEGDNDAEVHKGIVVDGDVLNDDGDVLADIEDGDGEEYIGLHQVCWELAGRKGHVDIAHLQQSENFTEVEKEWHRQVFPFENLASKEVLWWIIDPTMDSGEAKRNKERILTILAVSKSSVRTPKRSKLEIPPGPALPSGFDGNTLYQTLGIGRDATEAQLEWGFKRKRLRCHPNAAGGGNPAQYEQVRIAYFLLTRFRQEYDSNDFNREEDRNSFARKWDLAKNNLI